MQEEVEGQNVSKVKICLSRETAGDTDRPLYGDTRGDFRSHSEEVFIHADMEEFHRRLVSGVAVAVTLASAIFTVNRDKKREMSLEVSSKNSKYRADRIAA